LFTIRLDCRLNTHIGCLQSGLTTDYTLICLVYNQAWLQTKHSYWLFTIRLGCRLYTHIGC